MPYTKQEMLAIGGHEGTREVIATLLPTPTASDTTRWGRYEAAMEIHAMALGRSAPAPTVVGCRGGNRLSPELVEWMMMLPAGWVINAPIGRNAQIKALGNGVVPLQAAMAFREICKIF